MFEECTLGILMHSQPLLGILILSVWGHYGPCHPGFNAYHPGCNPGPTFVLIPDGPILFSYHHGLISYHPGLSPDLTFIGSDLPFIGSAFPGRAGVWSVELERLRKLRGKQEKEEKEEKIKEFIVVLTKIGGKH